MKRIYYHIDQTEEPQRDMVLHRFMVGSAKCEQAKLEKLQFIANGLGDFLSIRNESATQFIVRLASSIYSDKHALSLFLSRNVHDIDFRNLYNSVLKRRCLCQS